ncbi:MAG TPA: DUF6754 domain-containing protein [Candidatus Angelobacter sp.]|nr:DUF6754 domain-containing protein [Candidatus Angelobacter sp.]
MPEPAELVGQLVRLVGEILGRSSLRFEIVPTLAVLGVLLVLLQLVARPVTRWTSRDAGGLAGVGRAMALAAESGTDAVVALGTAGIVRGTDSLARLQTLAALPLLGHVARAAARSGVPLRVLTNDPLAAAAAAAAVESAHDATSTRERSGRSRAVYVGEGRGVAAGLALTTRARPAAAFAFGSLREEAQLHLDGLGGRAGSLTAATAEPAQAGTLLLATPDALVGPGLYHAVADLRADVIERTTVLAANRLIGLAVVVVLAGGTLAWAVGLEPMDVIGLARR